MKIKNSRALTIYDGEKYFDATFSSEECEQIRDLIKAEIGLDDDNHFSGIRATFDLINKADKKIAEAFGTSVYKIPVSWSYIHVCRELEIDYKSLAKNLPKLSIEPFYAFVESQFPSFKPAKNDSQRTIQTKHIHLAFIDWIDVACPASGCKKSDHGFSCWDRFEEADYTAAAKRIWEFNGKRPRLKIGPLRLVHSV